MMQTLILGLLLTTTVFSAEALRKPAVLFMPESIECEIGHSADLRMEIGFRWDEVVPLKVSVWQSSKPRDGDRLLCDIAIFDEKGHELVYTVQMSLPPMPSGEIVIRKGEIKRFKAFMFGAHVFPRSGDYYATATFSDAHAADKAVMFTTSKTWFKVIAMPAKPIKT